MSVYPQVSTSFEPLKDGLIEMLVRYLKLMSKLITLPDPSSPETLSRGFLHFKPGTKLYELESKPSKNPFRCTLLDDDKVDVKFEKEEREHALGPYCCSFMAFRGAIMDKD